MASYGPDSTAPLEDSHHVKSPSLNKSSQETRAKFRRRASKDDLSNSRSKRARIYYAGRRAFVALPKTINVLQQWSKILGSWSRKMERLAGDMLIVADYLKAIESSVAGGEDSEDSEDDEEQALEDVGVYTQVKKVDQGSNGAEMRDVTMEL